MDSPAFAGFCDALASNKSLIELDLRNNDISHVGGSELAAALKRNVTLRVLGMNETYVFIKSKP
jgi:Ran GTPase-activating protein (RanGAP) involved in mRNA processing and transport